MATVNSIKNQIVKQGTNQGATQVAPKTVQGLLNTPSVQERFKQVLGARTQTFVASLLSLSNTMLQGVEATSIISAGMIASTLDLPINPNLGFAYIVPFNEKQQNGTYLKKAQFQIGYKGLIQLAIRTGQYQHINVIEIYEGQLKDYNPLYETLDLDFKAKTSDNVIGYVAWFKLINGFEKTCYWSVEDVRQHAQKYSKTFKFGVWQKNFDSMAKKTVLKNTLSKWGILSIELQRALMTDQAVISNDVLNKDIDNLDSTDLNYIDNMDNEIIDVEIEEVNQEMTDQLEGQLNVEDILQGSN